MSLERDARERLVRALAAAMIEHAEELTSLDQAIGDGDHGLNMKRGFEAVRDHSAAAPSGAVTRQTPQFQRGDEVTRVDAFQPLG